MIDRKIEAYYIAGMALQAGAAYSLTRRALQRFGRGQGPPAAAGW
jgi:hypothetical protein